MNDSEATDFGTRRAAKVSFDDIEEVLLKTRKSARAFFSLLNKINYETNDIIKIKKAATYTPPKDSKQGENKENNKKERRFFN